MRKQSEDVRQPPDRTTPYWVPEGEFYDHLPENVKRAVCRVLNPAYRQLVLDAPDELQRSAGLTLVHLIWLEICDQLELGETVADRESIFAQVKDPETLLGRHLRLVAAKCKATELLMKVRMFSKMMGCLESPPLTHSGPPDDRARLPVRRDGKLLTASPPPQNEEAFLPCRGAGDATVHQGETNGKRPGR